MKYHSALISLTAVVFAVTACSEAAASEEGNRGVRPSEGQEKNRKLMTCDDSEKIFKLSFTTDSSLDNAEYEIEQYVNGSWGRIYRETDPQLYTIRRCVLPGDYRLIVSGSNVCYSGYLTGQLEFTSCGDGTHYFTLGQSQLPSDLPPETSTPKPTPTPTSTPTSKPTEPDMSGRMSNCASSEYLFSFEIQLDRNGDETSWWLKNSAGSTLLKNSRTYGVNDYELLEVCLLPAEGYVLSVKDDYGDGICCGSGNGYYKAYINGAEIISGGQYINKVKEHSINLLSPAIDDRAQDWLDSHNSRRREWHQNYGQKYVPLRWSNGLKAQAQVWANELLDKTCGSSLYHDPDNHSYGENLAAKSGSGSWGSERTTDEVLSRFVEAEQSKTWPDNAHFTQVLWRATEYVGCSDADKQNEDGSWCRVQVCRYSRAGNCDMSLFKDGSSNWWMKGVMQDSSNCGNACPPEGCHHYD